jgi:hypothetical protein
MECEERFFWRVTKKQVREARFDRFEAELARGMTEIYRGIVFHSSTDGWWCVDGV